MSIDREPQMFFRKIDEQLGYPPKVDVPDIKQVMDDQLVKSLWICGIAFVVMRLVEHYRS